jgi:beta-phosphoglucomutase-like phosphatase (HAD superfamily)
MKRLKRNLKNVVFAGFMLLFSRKNRIIISEITSFFNFLKKRKQIMREIRAIIFDMDGVLVDSELLYYEILQEIFIEYQIPVTKEEFAGYVGTSDMWEQIIARHCVTQSVDHLEESFSKRLYATLDKGNFPPEVPGSCNLVAQLARLGVPMAVASSSSIRLITALLTSLDIIKKFPVIVSGENVTNSKPAPDIFLLAAEKLQVSPVHCLVLEDSANGVRGGKTANMAVIGYRNPNSGHQNLEPADAIIDSWSEVTTSGPDILAGFSRLVNKK